MGSSLNHSYGDADQLRYVGEGHWQRKWCDEHVFCEVKQLFLWHGVVRHVDVQVWRFAELHSCWSTDKNTLPDSVQAHPTESFYVVTHRQCLETYNLGRIRVCCSEHPYSLNIIP